VKEYVVAIDLMGGDSSPSLIYESALIGVSGYDHVKLQFLTTKAYEPPVSSPHTILVCPDYITSLDHPLKSIRAKKKSTLCTGIDLLFAKKIDAFLSLGNTGAILAKAVTTLPCIDDYDRPALLTEIPIRDKMVAVLDVGASTQARASHLVQFAFLGASYMQKSYAIAKPKIALLNIGVEPEKGTGELKLAFDMLSQLRDPPFEFVGNVEPNIFFNTDIDVLVTSGFAGNIFLKTIEGTASFVLDLVAQLEEPSLRLSPKLRQALYARPSFGGIVVGIEKLLIKCHGGATKEMIVQALRSSIERLLQM